MNAIVHSTETGTPDPDLKAPKQVQKRASAHEKTVQAVAEGKVQPTPRKRQRRAPSAASKPSTAVTHVQLDKRVLAAVKKIIADRTNTYSSYVIVDHETARVR